MKPYDLPSPDYLRECFDYDPETGVLTWRERPRSHFSSDKLHKRWNTRYAKTPCGFVHFWGYRLVGINSALYPSKRQFKAHRIIWKLVHGYDPIEFIDHINMDKADNRLCNLRETGKSGNSINRPLRGDNKSGVTGVFWHPASKKWTAYINLLGTRTNLGYFANKDDAISARRRAEETMHAEFSPRAI